MDFEVDHVEILSLPRTYFMFLSSTQKLEANIVAVTLRQSEQLQTKVASTLSTAYRVEESVMTFQPVHPHMQSISTYKLNLYSTTEAGCGRGLVVGPAITAQRKVRFGRWHGGEDPSIDMIISCESLMMMPCDFVGQKDSLYMDL